MGFNGGLARLLLVLLGSTLISCGHTNRPADKKGSPSTPQSEPARGAWSPEEQRRIDALVTPELVFPSPDERRLFDMHAPTMEADARSYAFELKAQPTMSTSRHFCLVSITFAHASAAGDQPGSPTLSGTAGPNGSFVDASARTVDRAYQVRVSQAMLLPTGVEVPPFDPMKALADLLARYESAIVKP